VLIWRGFVVTNAFTQMGVAVSLLSEVFEEQEPKSVSNIMFGRYMLPDRSEHASQIKNLSPEGATFSCTNPPTVGDHIIAYIEEIGRVEGDVTEVSKDEFHLELTVASSKRDKIAAKLNWLMERDEEGGADMRRHARYEPSNGNTILTMPDGRQYSCEIIDMSISGAAIKISMIPSIGTNVALGKMRGTVSRIIECGVAIEFTQLIEPTALEQQVS
jgi:hypothetical protein